MTFLHTICPHIKKQGCLNYKQKEVLTLAKVTKIQAQYTVDTYIEYLRKYTENYCKSLQMQGVTTQNIEVQRNKFINAVEETRNLTGTARLHKLAQCMGECTAFCQTAGDIFSTAVRTVKDYCSNDVLYSYGVNTLAEQLCKAVPAECWYATDMRESGKKTRDGWCSIVFPGTYHRIPNLKEITIDTPLLYKFFANCELTPNGVKLFGRNTVVVDVIDNKGVTALNHCIIQEQTYVNPAADNILRVYMQNAVLLVRVYTADDNSGVKGKKAVYVTAYSPNEDCRYTKMFPVK